MIGRDPATPAWIVTGDVVHKRLRPRTHAMRYRVFSLLLDLDQVARVSTACRLFSSTGRNAIEFRESDHLSGGRNGPLAAEARGLFQAAGFNADDARILLLAYPRIFGFAFNPIAVFFLIAPDGGVRAAIYDVSNTFGERKSYVAATGAPRAGTTYAHSFDKELFVSPFAASTGRYDFRLDLGPHHVTVGVMFRDGDGPLIKTHFRGVPEPLITRTASRALARLPLLTGKVVAGIHWEALKLWVKGVPLVRRHRSPAYSVTHVAPVTPARTTDHVRS